MRCKLVGDRVMDEFSSLLTDFEAKSHQIGKTRTVRNKFIYNWNRLAKKHELDDFVIKDSFI